MVDRSALGEPGNVIVTDRRDLRALRRWAEVASAGGAEVWMQINHPGRQAPRWLSRQPVAPSAIAIKGLAGAFARPRALEEGEIELLVRRFATTATIAEEAGFSGVQLHAAHGYLISQFLSPRTNQRTDGWGGELAGRMRFLLEIVRAVRAAVSPDFALSVKLNSADFQRGGFSQEDSTEVVRVLGRERVDLLEISGGTYEQVAMWGNRPPSAASTAGREAYFLEYAEAVRKVARMPVLLTGGMRTAAGMRAAVASGAIDLVGLARPLAVEPDLPARILQGRSEGAVRVNLRTGLRKLDSVIEGAFYQRQLARMSRGLDPEPRGRRLAALFSMFQTVRRGLARRRSVRKELLPASHP